MKRVVITGIFGLAATSLLVVTATGCSSDKSSTASSSSSTTASSAKATTSATAATPSDYSTLLIKAADIQAPGDTFADQGAPAPLPGAQPGITQAFANQRGDRIIGDTIAVFPDAAAAATALEGAKGALGSSVTGTPSAVDVGTGGTIVSGEAPDGSKAVTVVLFTEGKAFTTLEFDSGPSDAVPPEFATDVATKQDEAIKAGLPA